MSQSSPSSPSAASKPSDEKHKQPEKKIGPFPNGIGAGVWLNTVKTDDGPRQFRSITINPRRYFDAVSQQWKNAPSYNLADLPSLIFALTKAQEYCYETPLPGQQPPESAPPPRVPDDEIPF